MFLRPRTCGRSRMGVFIFRDWRWRWLRRLIWMRVIIVLSGLAGIGSSGLFIMGLFIIGLLELICF